MNGLLVRVGIDGTKEYGGWNAPVDPYGRFVFVPISDESYVPATGYIEGGRRDYGEVIPVLQNFAKRCGSENLPSWQLPEGLYDKPMHLDPDFLKLTYGDMGNRGRKLENLKEDDFLIFYSGLRPQSGDHLVYALIGVFVLAGRPRRIHEIPRQEWVHNAHTRWAELPEESDNIVVQGKPGCSGVFEQCIPIGEWRESAYRVKEELLQAWGGLGVKNGWIQRSANLPEFSDSSRFWAWLQEQNPTIKQSQF